MMKCICGFLRPTTGRVMVDGREVGKDMDFPKDLGMRRLFLRKADAYGGKNF